MKGNCVAQAVEHDRNPSAAIEWKECWKISLHLQQKCPELFISAGGAATRVELGESSQMLGLSGKTTTRCREKKEP